jgi:hypothetical protein
MSKGRGNASSLTTNGAMRLNINDLYKRKVIQEGKEIECLHSWTNGAKIKLVSVSNETETYIRLVYISEGKSFDYKVYIVFVPSNLGKGYNRYFICPVSATRCKILYLCYGVKWFKCRQAYKNLIYYPLQKQSKEYNFNGRVFNYEAKIEKLDLLRKQKTYKGKPTKRSLRTVNLWNKKALAEERQNEQLQNWLNKYLGL